MALDPKYFAPTEAADYRGMGLGQKPVDMSMSEWANMRADVAKAAERNAAELAARQNAPSPHGQTPKPPRVNPAASLNQPASAAATAEGAAGRSVLSRAAGTAGRLASGVSRIAGPAGAIYSVNEGLGELGRQADRTPERQALNRSNMGSRGRLSGYYPEEAVSRRSAPQESPSEDLAAVANQRRATSSRSVPAAPNPEDYAPTAGIVPGPQRREAPARRAPPRRAESTADELNEREITRLLNERSLERARAGEEAMKKGGLVKMAKGGHVKGLKPKMMSKPKMAGGGSVRGCGIAQRGKTRGKVV